MYPNGMAGHFQGHTSQNKWSAQNIFGMPQSKKAA